MYYNKLITHNPIIRLLCSIASVGVSKGAESHPPPKKNGPVAVLQCKLNGHFRIIPDINSIFLFLQKNITLVHTFRGPFDL